MSRGSAPVRIGFDAIRALRNRTGLGNYSRGVLRALRQYDSQLDIHLYSPREPRQEFRDFPAEINASVHLPDSAAGSGLRTLGSGLVPWRTFRLGRQAALDGIDLYHGLTHEIPRDLPRTGIPSVVTFADLIVERQPQLFPPFDRWSYRWRYRWSAAHATAIVVISARTRADLVELYRVDPARVAIVPPVRNPTFAAPIGAAQRAAVRARYGLPREFLLSIGTLEPRKNHRVLVTALVHLERAGALPLVLVGRDGGSLAALRTMIVELRLVDRVHILTDVSTADLPALMQDAAVFLYPSRIEGFGMPIVEALSASAPVVAAGGGHLDEAGGPDTQYVAPDDSAAWAAAIDDVLGNSALAERMRQAGAAYATRFDGSVLAARLMRVYDAVLKGEAANIALPYL